MGTRRITFIGLLAAVAVGNAVAQGEVPNFDLSGLGGRGDLRRGGAVPSMRVTFPGRPTTGVTLEKFDPYGDGGGRRSGTDDGGCAYVGTLDDDPEGSSVAVTGCSDEDEDGVQVTVVGNSVGDHMYQIKDGVVSEIPPPFESGLAWSDSAAVDDVEIPVGDDGYQGFMRCMDGGCNDGPLSSRASIPSDHILYMAIGYDDSLNTGQSNPTGWISSVMAHVQGRLRHSSLPTRMNIRYVRSPKHFSGQTWKAENDIRTVRNIVRREGPSSANLVAFFCKDTAYYGTVGIAYVGVTCNRRGYQVSVNEWRRTVAGTGFVVAHELGHNMGMYHDFDPRHAGRNCNGIMDYGANSGTWSACSRDDFLAHYNSQARFCLTVGS